MELAIFIVRCFPSGNNGAMVKAGQRSTSDHVFTFEYSVLFPCICRFFSYHVSFFNVSAFFFFGTQYGSFVFFLLFFFHLWPTQIYWLIKKNSNYQKSPIIDYISFYICSKVFESRIFLKKIPQNLTDNTFDPHFVQKISKSISLTLCA